jgi:hypothetical protein
MRIFIPKEYRFKRGRSPQHSNIKRDMKLYLTMMRDRFSKLSYDDKIELLKEASNKVFKYYFNYRRNRRKSYRVSMKPCVVCGKAPTITHHIIQVQNGGMNISENLIKLCEVCHAQVHSWLMDRVGEKLNKQMDEEYRAIVGL